LDYYRKCIQRLPKADDDHPEAFGQHPNADIASQNHAAKNLLPSVLSLQRATVLEGAKSMEEIVLELIKSLQQEEISLLDVPQYLVKFEHDHSPLTVVLLQEMQRYNELLRAITVSLKDLHDALKGFNVISTSLEVMLGCLYRNKVPPGWSFAFPSLKPLSAWTRDLQVRITQLRTWADTGNPPIVFWLGGFTFPVGFLTAVLQVFSRRCEIGIATLSWEFLVTQSLHDTSINVAPKDGAYVKDLFLEGARWDVDQGNLEDAAPMELVCPMPIIHFKPSTTKKNLKGLHKCPLYIYPVRTGTRERPSFMLEIDLRSGSRDTAFWTKRGTALLLSLAE